MTVINAEQIGTPIDFDDIRPGDLAIRARFGMVSEVFLVKSRTKRALTTVVPGGPYERDREVKRSHDPTKTVNGYRWYLLHRPSQEAADDPESRYDDAVAQMADPERYEALMALTWDQRHPCPVEGCRLSAEEHHRLSFGVLSELKALRRRMADLENGAGVTEASP